MSVSKTNFMSLPAEARARVFANLGGQDRRNIALVSNALALDTIRALNSPYSPHLLFDRAADLFNLAHQLKIPVEMLVQEGNIQFFKQTRDAIKHRREFYLTHAHQVEVLFNTVYPEVRTLILHSLDALSKLGLERKKIVLSKVFPKLTQIQFDRPRTQDLPIAIEFLKDFTASGELKKTQPHRFDVAHSLLIRLEQMEMHIREMRWQEVLDTLILSHRFANSPVSFAANGLQDAVAQGNQDAARALIALGADMNSMEPLKETFLNLPACEGIEGNKLLASLRDLLVDPNSEYS